MKTINLKYRLAVFTILAVAFNFLFWRELAGLNYLLYTSIFVGFLVGQNPQRLKDTKTVVSLIALLVTVFSVLWVNSILSIIMYFISVGLFITFFYQNKLKSVYYALPASVLNLFYSTLNIVAAFKASAPGGRSSKKLSKWLKILIAPLIITLVFGIIYLGSNPFIEEYSIIFIDNISSYFNTLFENYPFSRFLFILLGILPAGYFVFYKSGSIFSNIDDHQEDEVLRIKKRKQRSFKLNALLNEYRSALVTLVMVNVMVFLVNFVDVWKVWISFDYDQGASLSSELHKGIYLLILSILLSIGVLAYFFRGNLNFLRNNKALKVLGHIWLVQNIVLACTAFIKCMYYINYYSFTYKRIGVLVFLLGTMFGLVMMFIKLEKRKSMFFLLRANTWFIYLLLVGSTLVNWDHNIAEYNLSEASESAPDYLYLKSLSAKAYPVLLHNKGFLLDQEYNVKYWNHEHIDSLLERYLYEQNQLTALSWNHSDYMLTKYFKEHLNVNQLSLK